MHCMAPRSPSNNSARVNIPDLGAPPDVNMSQYGIFIQDIETMGAHWACVFSTDSSTGQKANGEKKRREYTPFPVPDSNDLVPHVPPPASATCPDGTALNFGEHHVQFFLYKMSFLNTTMTQLWGMIWLMQMKSMAYRPQR